MGLSLLQKAWMGGMFLLACSSPIAPTPDQIREEQRSALQGYLLGHWVAHSPYTVGNSSRGIFRGYLEGRLLLAASPQEGKTRWVYRMVFTDKEGYYARWFSLPTDTTDVEEGTWRVLPPEREGQPPLIDFQVDRSRFHPEELGVHFRLEIEPRPPSDVRIGRLWWARVVSL